MPNFVKDNTALPFPKLNRRALPAGANPDQYLTGTEWNVVCQGLDDVRDFLRAAEWYGLVPQNADPAPSGIGNYIWLKDDGTLWKTVGGVATEIGSGGGGSLGAELSITPEGPWYEAPGTHLPAGRVDNYSAHPHLQTRTVLCVMGADNQATIFTGISATGITAGDFRILMDTSPTGHQDAGVILFKHEDSNSLAANRFWCPGHHDYVQPPGGMTILKYGEDSRWHILAPNGRSFKSICQSLQIYSKALIGQATPISGTFNDWDPTGWTGFGGYGINGSDGAFKNHTAIEVVTDAAGATITGFNVQSLQADPAYYGALKFICNRGPGALTLKYRNAGSVAQNRIYTPNAEDVVLQSGETAWIYYGYYDPDTTQPNWRVVATSQSATTFRSVTTTGRTTTKTLSIGPHVSPAALAAGLTSDYDPGSEAVISVAGTTPVSALDGLVPNDLVNGEVRILRNNGAVPIVLIDDLDSASSADNRFTIPTGTPGDTSIFMLLPNQEVVLHYRPTTNRWAVLCNSILGNFNTSTSITPAALAGAVVNDWAPVDATSGLSGRYAYWWFIQGAFGTELTGIDAAPAGTIPFKKGDRILLTNLGSGMTIKNNIGTSAVGNRFLLSGDIVLSANGSHEFIYNGAVWMSTSKT